MKKIMILCVLLTLILALAGCGAQSAPVEAAETAPQFEFNYILVEEAGTCYLHKLESWSTENGIFTFKCSVCGNTIRVSETDAVMYDKVSLDTAWSDYVDVCSGDASDWHDLLGD